MAGGTRSPQAGGGGLRNLTGAGPSTVSRSAAMRARDVSRPRRAEDGPWDGAQDDVEDGAEPDDGTGGNSPLRS